MCPQGPTCCTGPMEDGLARLGTQETQDLIREAGRSLQAALNALYRSFDCKYQARGGGRGGGLYRSFDCK